MAHFCTPTFLPDSGRYVLLESHIAVLMASSSKTLESLAPEQVFAASFQPDLVEEFSTLVPWRCENSRVSQEEFMKFAISALAIVVLGVCPTVLAQSTTCTSPSYLVPDGRSVESSFAANTYWFAFHGVAGHSYTLEYGAFHSNNNSIFVSPTIYAPADTPCTGGSSTLTVTTTTYVDPYIGDGGSSRRRSWIAPSEGNYFISLASSGSDLVSYRVVDTTLFQATWTTGWRFFTQLAFKNTTSSTISCIYTATVTYGGSGSATLTLSLPAGGSLFRTIGLGGDIVQTDSAGDATLACSAPPGAVIANAFLVAPSNLMATVPFGPRDSQH